MKTTITPLGEEDAARVCREFLTAEFRSQELGQPGRWLILRTPRPGLVDPVQASQFDTLIEASRSNDGNGYPTAWRLDFEVGRGVTALWALSSKPIAESIEQAHRVAVEAAIMYWLPRLSDPRRKVIHEGPDAALALFASGTGEGQIPYLHTTAFLFNTNSSTQAQNARFPTERVTPSEGYLDAVYRAYLDAAIAIVIGPIGKSPKTDVPRRLFSRLFELSDKEPNRYAPFGGPNTGEELFTLWRRQARVRGFGTEQVEALLFNVQREVMRMDRAYIQLMRTSTLGIRIERWLRQRCKSLNSFIPLSKLLNRNTETPPKAQSAQPSKEHDMFHSH